MANNCEYVARITGKKENVQNLISMMQEHQIGRIFSCDEYDSEEHGGVMYTNVCGDCAWSIYSSMIDVSPSILTEIRKQHLIVEMYSSEPGIGFQEHYTIEFGNIIEDQCVEYGEYFIDDYKDLNELNEFCGTKFTEDMIDDSGYIRIGGFGSYESFIDIPETKF